MVGRKEGVREGGREEGVREGGRKEGVREGGREGGRCTGVLTQRRTEKGRLS